MILTLQTQEIEADYRHALHEEELKKLLAIGSIRVCCGY
jgi:hypothetical protein